MSATDQPEADEHGYTRSESIEVGTMPRDQLAALFHASFYLTANDHLLPDGHPPTHAMLAQIRLGELLGEPVPDAIRQQVESMLKAQEEAALRRQQALEAARRAQRGV